MPCLAREELNTVYGISRKIKVPTSICLKFNIGLTNPYVIYGRRMPANNAHFHRPITAFAGCLLTDMLDNVEYADREYLDQTA